MIRRTTRPTLAAVAALTAAVTGGTALAATPSPTSLTIKAAKTTVAHNTKTTLTGTLKSGNAPVAGEPVKLEKRAYGTKNFTVVSTKTTSAKGTVSYTVVPGTRKGQKTQYELVFAGDSKYKASHSSVITITVT